MNRKAYIQQTSFILCIMMIFSLFSPFFVMAEENQIHDENTYQETVIESVYEVDQTQNIQLETVTNNVYLSIEGINNTLLEKTVMNIGHEDVLPTALDVLEVGLNDANIEYQLVDSSLGILVVGIGEDTAGTFGGYDGWMYRVNGISPDVGASSYTVSDGDEVSFYYNRWPALSSQSTIEKGDIDASIEVRLMGDQFTQEATTLDHWSLDTGSTTLTVNRVTISDSMQNAVIEFTGTADTGILSVQAQAGALEGAGSSNTVQVFVNQTVAFEAQNHEWVVNGQTVLDALLKYQQPDGSFWWTQETAGGVKGATVDALDALVNIGLGASNKHLTGTSPGMQNQSAQLQQAMQKTINWYNNNHPAPDNWAGITALKNAGHNVNEAPWLTTQKWRTTNPGFSQETIGNEHIHAIYRLLAVEENPDNAWDGRNLYTELLAQQKSDGSFGDLGKHIWAMAALDTGKNLGHDVGQWNTTKQEAALKSLISWQNQNGSFGPFSELDFTGWALVALSPYKGNEINIEGSEIDQVIAQAVAFIKSRQKTNAGFDMEGEWGAENANTNAAVIAGLAAIGENILPAENVIDITGDTTPYEINIENGSTVTFLDAVTNEENGHQVTVLPSIKASTHTALGSYTLDILQGTKVTGPNAWDGTIQLPRPLDPAAVIMNQGTVLSAAQAGYTGGSLTFSKAVRLKLPGQAGKSAGFMQEGQFTEITDVLYSDNGDWMEPGETGKIDVGDDLVIWTTHFTTFVAYDKTETAPPADGEGTPGSDNRASLSVRGYENQLILPSTQSSVESNETVQTFTEKVLSNQGISFDFNGGYLRMVNGLAEFDKGAESGWVFSINGSYPETGASSVKVYPQDEIQWKYTTELLPGSEKPIVTAGQLSAYLNLKQAGSEAITWILAQRDFSQLDNFTDWDAMVLARNGETVPDDYLKSLESLLKERDGSFRLVTDVARIMLSTTALGIHAEDVFGYNLLEALLNHENMLLQGVNGPAHALLALDAHNYEVPEEALWNREKLIEEMVRLQKRHGGYSLSEKPEAPGDIDLTAMVLQALAPYDHQKEAAKASDRALAWLQVQSFDNAESIAQTILALAAHNQDATEITFEHLEKTLLHELMKYQKSDGSFSHRENDEASEIATQQALMALTAYHRFVEGEPTFFDMQDVTLNNTPGENDQLEESWEDRLKQVKLADENQVSTWALEWVKKAVAYGLMSGVSQEELRFDPLRELTRAEFTVLMTKTLEADVLTSSNVNYRDVQPDSWYYEHVMSASEQGWMSGVGAYEFAPQKTITRQEMAVVLKKALQLELLEGESSEKPLDIHIAAPWASTGVEAVYQQRLMVGDGQHFMPLNTVTREMAAVIMVKLYEAQLQE